MIALAVVWSIVYRGKSKCRKPGRRHCIIWVGNVSGTDQGCSNGSDGKC